VDTPPSLTRAVFLDRDGVLNVPVIKNGKPYPPAVVEEFRLIAGVEEATEALVKAGFLLIVITNQPDPLRGTQRKETVEEMHALLKQWLPIHDILTAWDEHSPDYKPGIGLIEEAVRKYNIDLKQSFFVGDRWRDVECGKRAGCFTILVDNKCQEPLTSEPDLYCANLLEAARSIYCNPTIKGKSMMTTKDFKIKIFADGAEVSVMKKMTANPLIKGFTTNPTLMRKAGVTNYEDFARLVVSEFKNYPISLEVFADTLPAMEQQAQKLASLGDNVYVKIPVTNTKGLSTAPLIHKLSSEGIKVNITAVMLLSQVEEMTDALQEGVPSYISIFAGRIADTGIDPVPLMQKSLATIQKKSSIELLWASPRELLNVIQADQIGCHIITATTDILAKLTLIGKDLTEYSLDTVKMFYQDALAADYNIALTDKIAV
jgi:transaldolase